MSSFDWGPNSDESEEEVAKALHKVTSETHKRRARRQVAATSLAAIVLIGGFVGGSAWKSSHKKDTVALVSQSEAPVTTASTVGNSSTSVAAVDATKSRPAIVYTAQNSNDGKGSIVAINSQTGKAVRTLASGSTMNDLTLSPDHKTLFYTELDKSKVPADGQMFDLGASLKSVPVDGGSVTFYAYNANSPKVSPDGTKVAYDELGLSGVSGLIKVMDIASKQSTYVTNLDASNPSKALPASGWIRSVVGWTDSTHVAAIAAVFPADSKSVENKMYLHVFDTKNREPEYGVYESSNPANVFAFPKSSNDTLYSAVLIGTSQIFAVEDNGSSLGARMLVMDRKNGAIVRTVATGYVGRAYGNPAADASANHLIYMSGNDVRVSDFGGNPTVLATGITSATW